MERDYIFNYRLEYNNHGERSGFDFFKMPCEQFFNGLFFFHLVFQSLFILLSFRAATQIILFTFMLIFMSCIYLCSH